MTLTVGMNIVHYSVQHIQCHLGHRFEIQVANSAMVIKLNMKAKSLHGFPPAREGHMGVRIPACAKAHENAITRLHENNTGSERIL
jgi:hypothetical protein